MTTLAATHPAATAANPAPTLAASARPQERSASALWIQTFTAAVVLAAFTAFSLWVVYGYGYTGFLSLAGREPWALQLLLDLAISLSFTLGWLRADARKRGIAAWPYFVAALFLGSIGVLAYVVRRGLGGAQRS
ncbi:MAG TPA: hypothetical protein VNO30_45855 [Kofleriaceae bacterium]|nr:hypothetical protein [Kofleriaceae bacterium]